MEINENTLELFEKYLNDSLKLNEVMDFEKKIKSDKNFSDRFSEFKAAEKAVAILARQRFKHKLSTIISEEGIRAAKPKKRNSLKKIVSEVFNEFFFPYENVLTARSDAPKDEALLKAMSLYSIGEYKNASIIFKKLIKKDSKNLLYYFYYGISELALNNFENSRKLFKKIISDDKEILHELAKWYLGLNYLKSGNIKYARKQFEDLTYSSKSNDSQRILQEIKNI